MFGIDNSNLFLDDCTTDAECNNHGNCKNGGCICAVNYWGQFCQHGMYQSLFRVA